MKQNRESTEGYSKSKMVSTLEVIGKYPVIPDTRAHWCNLMKVNYLASIMYFYVLFTVHFVKAFILKKKKGIILVM